MVTHRILAPNVKKCRCYQFSWFPLLNRMNFTSVGIRSLNWLSWPSLTINRVRFSIFCLLAEFGAPTKFEWLSYPSKLEYQNEITSHRLALWIVAVFLYLDRSIDLTKCFTKLRTTLGIRYQSMFLEAILSSWYQRKTYEHSDIFHRKRFEWRNHSGDNQNFTVISSDFCV